LRRTVFGPTADSFGLWDRLRGGPFVADAYVGWPAGRPDVPWWTLTEGGVPGDHEAFIAWAAPMAQTTFAVFHVPASVTLAQAILESGWGAVRSPWTGTASSA